MINNHPCTLQSECVSLYNCIDGICTHKNFFPPTFSESIGMLSIAIFTGFASLAGIGGGGVVVSLMTMFFNYSQKEALLGVFLPIFGAALGNFLNLAQQLDPQTKTPVVKMRSAIVACPAMIIGSMVGLILNKILPAFFLISILQYFLFLSCQKFYKTALKEWNNENQRKLNQNSVEIPILNKLSEEKQLPLQNTSLKENLDLIVAICVIVITVLLGFFLRGSANFQSIIGISYCGFFYWMITFGLVVILYYYFDYIFDRFQKEELKPLKKECLRDSFKAGIFNGFGLGGGMILIPMYLGMGFTTIQSTGTSSFNVLLSSFQVAAQVIILGYMGTLQAFSLFTMTVIGCYFSSSFIFNNLKKRDRLSLIMWGLVGFVIFAMVNLAIQFLQKWSHNGYQIFELFAFQSIC
ncbi:unnamed protein product [Paramecium pentaurelia]|uniref:Sulfite exporter TauE/SafE family protein n=1 Tax=Paramecium pentaurelia TaxID=43138 RepID=A0A8S1WUM0_9CILI|nr:unnamed protein product [Paramecium pentaurelia]